MLIGEAIRSGDDEFVAVDREVEVAVGQRSGEESCFMDNAPGEGVDTWSDLLKINSLFHCLSPATWELGCLWPEKFIQAPQNSTGVVYCSCYSDSL